MNEGYFAFVPFGLFPNELDDSSRPEDTLPRFGEQELWDLAFELCWFSFRFKMLNLFSKLSGDACFLPLLCFRLRPELVEFWFACLPVDSDLASSWTAWARILLSSFKLKPCLLS